MAPETPLNLSDLVSTTVLSSRGDSKKYAAVAFDKRVTKASYRVHNAKNGDPSASVSQSGNLETKLPNEGHAFMIPVTKGMVYFIEVVMEVDGGWNEPQATLTWVLAPVKRRQASREERTPAAPSK
jgi:hypothetical protein